MSSSPWLCFDNFNEVLHLDEKTKIPTKSEITKLPLDREITKIPLPVNGHRNSSDGDGKLRSDSSDLGESNGGGRDLPRALPAADRSSKICKLSGGRSAIIRPFQVTRLVGK